MDSDEKDRTETTDDDARPPRESVARPEQPRPGFATGQEQSPAAPEDEQEPNFARGTAKEPQPGTEEHGRFSAGQEATPEENPAKDVERRFSQGQEED